MCSLKTEKDGRSKGFAFIRYASLAAQKKVLLTRHLIDDRWCDVKIPDSQEKDKSNPVSHCKIFVGRVTEDLSEDDLKEHFEQFGRVTDVFYPRKPFRGFAFVTFVEAKVAQSLLGKDHIIKGVSVHLGSAAPKSNSMNRNNSGSGGGNMSGMGGMSMGGMGMGMGNQQVGRREVNEGLFWTSLFSIFQQQGYIYRGNLQRQQQPDPWAQSGSGMSGYGNRMGTSGGSGMGRYGY